MRKIGLMILVSLVGLLMTGCKSIQYVPVESQHTEHHWHTDSVHTTDSVIMEKTTTVMQLDSAAMAKYGIELKNAERAWLVKTAELERQLQKLSSIKADTVRIVDSIQVPVPVEKKLTKWQQTCIDCGKLLMFISLAGVILLIVRLLKWKNKIMC
jgi:PBP1b-binding outer membrane lipoprotein LpoB